MAGRRVGGRRVERRESRRRSNFPAISYRNEEGATVLMLLVRLHWCVCRRGKSDGLCWRAQFDSRPNINFGGCVKFHTRHTAAELHILDVVSLSRLGSR